MKCWKKIFHANGDQKKARVVIIIKHKIGFKDSSKRQGMTLYYDQGINSRRRYNKYKYICTQHKNITICKTNANKYEREN